MADHSSKVGSRFGADPFQLIQANGSLRLATREGKRSLDLQRPMLERFPTSPGWIPYHPDLNPTQWHLRQFDLQNLLKSDPQMRGPRQDAMAEKAAAALAAYLELKRQAEVSLQQELAQKWELFRQSMLAWRIRTINNEIFHVLLRLRERDAVAHRHTEAYAAFDLRRRGRRDVIKESQELSFVMHENLRDERLAVGETRAQRQAAGADLMQNWAAQAQLKLTELRAHPPASEPAVAFASGESDKIVEMIGRSAYAAATKLR